MYMAMQPGNVVIPDKMHGAAVAGPVMMAHYPRQWVPDERDDFISWIRSEFAAANAIIDSMCNHLKVIGEPGEYDGVIGSLQQRRVNWYPVLHMQQYFSVSEVVHSLQQAAWRRQQHYQNHHHRNFDQFKGPGKRFGGGYRQGYQRGSEFNNQEANVNSGKGDKLIEKGDEGKLGDVIANSEEKDVSAKSHVDTVSQNFENLQANPTNEVEGADNGFTSDTKGSCDMPVEKDSSTSLFSPEKKNVLPYAKTFVGTEIVDGKSVNAVEGMKLYEDLLDSSEVANLVSLVNDLRTAGRKGHFQGPTFIISQRPSRGRGREMIQMGVPTVDTHPEDGTASGTVKERRIEPIPGLLQDVIERLITLQLITVMPDCCIIDIFNEGDHSQPSMWPQRFGRPVSVLLLTECDMIFGKVIAMDRPGDYRGSIKLSLTPGSMLVMQGRSTDFARHALPALQKQRILVTLTKSQPKKSVGGPYPSAMAATQSQWIPPHRRSSNHAHNSMSPKHHPSVSATGVVPGPPICMQLPPSNGVQPMFMPTAVAPVLPFPAPVALPPTSAGWTVAAPMHQPPRLPVPGTGVFLPPGSGIPNQTSSNESMPAQPEKDNGAEKLDDDNSAFSDAGKESAKTVPQDCNGNFDGERPVSKEQQNAEEKVANDPAGTVL